MFKPWVCNQKVESGTFPLEMHTQRLIGPEAKEI